MTFWLTKNNNMKFFQFTFCILLTLIVFNCDSDQEDIRDYYFPLKALQDGMVYEYEAITPDSLAPYYWYYRSFIQENAVYLTGTYYEVDLIPKQFIKESLVSNGMLLDTIIIYNTDSLNKQVPIDVKIESGAAYPFEVSLPSGVFVYNINWQDPDDSSTTTTLIKNRRYLGDTTFVFKNNTYECKAFEVRELVEVESEGVLEQEFQGVEFYAKGVGLVYTKKIINESLGFEYGLSKTYPMDTLETIFSKQYDTDY